MLNAVTYRTTSSCGILEDISYPPQKETDYTIIKSSDIPGIKYITFFENKIPVLAQNNINYRGEPLLVIAYKDEQSCSVAKKEIRVKIRETVSTGFEQGAADPDNIVYQKLFSTGTGQDENKHLKNESDSGKEESITVSDSFHAGEYHSRYCEPFGAVAQPHKNEMIVYTVSQWPNHVRKSVADSLNINQKNVKVINTALSSPLEGRIWYPSLVSVQAAVAANKTGKPVKLLLSRHETFSFTPRQHPFFVQYKTSVHQNGKLKKMEITLDIDGGAYPVLIEEVFEKTFLTASGLYQCSDVSLLVRVIKTNNPPMSFISSFNFSQLQISLEKHISNVIRKLRLSQVEWRKANILEKANKKISMGTVMDSDSKSISTNRASAISILESVASASDFERKYSAYELLRLNKSKMANNITYGIGISLGFYSNRIPLKSMEKEKLSLKLMLDSKSNLNIYTTTVPDGLNNYDIWKNCASEILGIPLDSIFVITHQTDLAPVSAAYPFSKGLVGFNELLRKSCQSLQKKRFRQPVPIEITSSLSLNKAGDDDPSWGAVVLELSFDNFTYEIDIKQIWCCFDCGQILHKEIIDKSVYSGIIDSLNWVSGAELMSLEKNKFVQSDNTWHFFNIPINTDYNNVARKNRSLLIGDLPLSLIPSAFFGALVQAAGKDVDMTPVTIDKIYNILNSDRTT